jgi:hypothetical protein
MVKSYEAEYDHGQLRWVGDQPPEGKLRVIVTVIEEETLPPQAKVLELLERARGCVKPPRPVQELDADLRALRAEWQEEWDR